MVETHSVAVYSCEKGEGIDDPQPELVGVLDSDDLATEGGSEVERICTSLIEEVLEKNYDSTDSKNARIHNFRDEATSDPVPVDGIEKSVPEILEEIREGTNLMENSRILSQLYLDEVLSQTDLIIVAHFEDHDEEFVAILKTPYLDGAHEIDLSASDTTELFIENERVIQERTDKSAIYPRYDAYEDEVDTSQVLIYQASGASHYASYWYGFLKLKEKLHPDEFVEAAIKERAKETENEAAYPSYQEFVNSGVQDTDTESETPPNSTESGKVSIRIAGRTIRASIEELRASESVQLARDGDQYYLLLSDIEPDITVGGGDSRRSLISDLTDVPNIRDLF